MARRRTRHVEKRHARLEIVPMIDIMMFLLVFFVMLVLRMIPDAGVSLQLPTASTAQALPPTQIVVVVDKTGTVHVQDHVYTPDALKAYLAQQKAEHQTNVIIAGDKETQLQQLMTVMNIARETGITDVGIATKQQ